MSAREGTTTEAKGVCRRRREHKTVEIPVITMEELVFGAAGAGGASAADSAQQAR